MRYNPFFQKFVAYLFVLGMLTSCNQYNSLPYLDSSSTNSENLVMDAEGNINSENIIVHSGGLTYKLSEVNSEKYKVTGKLVLFDIQAAQNLISSVEETTGIERQADNEMYSHVIDPSNSLEEGSEIMISVDEKTGAVEFKQKKGEVWVILSVVLVVIIGLIVGMIVLVLIACNCPHTYVFDGKKYHYTNTLFTGAIAANLERSDFKILDDFLNESSTYEMIVKNEQNEAHFFNLLELIVVGHDANTEIVPDQNGKIHAISKLVGATRIYNDRGEDLAKLMSNRDDLGYAFDSQSDENMVSAYATFERPADVSNAKLVLKLKNSEWGGLVYKTFATMMGDKYEGWVEKNRKRSPEQAYAAMQKAGIPLVLSIKNGNKWIEIETIDLIGEVSYNTLAVHIDESLMAGDEILIRIESGFKFWDLDYIGMDFSAEQDLDINIIKPTMSPADADKLLALENDDNLYMEHANSGDSTYFKFEGLTTSSEKRTIIVHSKGYYLSNDEYAGDPYWKQLVKLRAPGGLSVLSREIYDSFENLVLEPSVSQ